MMKILTLNFLTCARKTCKQSPAAFPLHPRDAELETVELDMSPEFIRNILPRMEWEALRAVCGELGLPTLPETAPSSADLFIIPPPPPSDSPSSTIQPQSSHPDQQQQELEATTTAAAAAAAASPEPSQTLRDLHTVLIETTMSSGKLVCGNCGHEYAVKEGIANFLLPPHMV